MLSGSFEMSVLSWYLFLMLELISSPCFKKKKKYVEPIS